MSPEEEEGFEIEILEDDEVGEVTPEAVGMPNILHDGELSELLKKVYADFREKVTPSITPLLTPLSPAPAPADPWQWPAFESQVTPHDMDKVRLRASGRTVTWSITLG